jgi:hypothetical protein
LSPWLRYEHRPARARSRGPRRSPPGRGLRRRRHARALDHRPRRPTPTTNHNGANNFGIVDGIFSSAGAWTGYTVLGETSNTTVRVGDNITNPDIANSKLAVFAAVPTTTTTHPGRGTYYTGSAIVVLDDAEDPGITVTHSSPVPTTWVKEYSDRASFVELQLSLVGCRLVRLVA